MYKSPLLVTGSRVFWYVFKNGHWPKGCAASHYSAGGQIDCAMAALLAHEVKNPLAGIKGAAQLLEADLESDGQNLTRMIVEESDRVAALLDRMEGLPVVPIWCWRR